MKAFTKGMRTFFAFGGLNREQRGGVFEAAAAIRCGGKVDVFNDTDGDWLGRVGEIENLATDEVADVVRVFVQFHAFGLGDDDFEAGQRSAALMESIPVKCRTMRPTFLPTGSQKAATSARRASLSGPVKPGLARKTRFCVSNRSGKSVRSSARISPLRP